MDISFFFSLSLDVRIYDCVSKRNIVSLWCHVVPDCILQTPGFFGTPGDTSVNSE